MECYKKLIGFRNTNVEWMNEGRMKEGWRWCEEQMNGHVAMVEWRMTKENWADFDPLKHYQQTQATKTTFCDLNLILFCLIWILDFGFQFECLYERYILIVEETWKKTREKTMFHTCIHSHWENKLTSVWFEFGWNCLRDISVIKLNSEFDPPRISEWWKIDQVHHHWTLANWLMNGVDSQEWYEYEMFNYHETTGPIWFFSSNRSLN